jgi:4'-phosphopantetheinyl transferase
MTCYWLEQTEADVPAENDWLSDSEAFHLVGMRVPKRRADWRLGRWTAKRAIAVYLQLPTDPGTLASIEIRPAPSGAPEVFLANRPAALAISLSHRGGTGLCAVGSSGVELGCDLELIEPRSDSFIADYFTFEEQALIASADAADRFCLLALLWSAKESTLKTLRTGLRVDTRCVTVRPADTRKPPVHHLDYESSGWRPLTTHCGDGRTFHGWWQQTGDLVRTLVAAPPQPPPIQLRVRQLEQLEKAG